MNPGEIPLPGKEVWAHDRFGRDGPVVLSLFILMDGGWEPPWGAFEEFSLRVRELGAAFALVAREDWSRIRSLFGMAR